VDIIDLGFRQYPTGSVIRVRPLGVLGLVDEGETDWKVVGISVQDPIADDLHTLDDVFNIIPGALEAFREWMRLYKSPNINKFAFDGAYLNETLTREVIVGAHEQWRELIKAKGPKATLA
jgi:inorganic pyrophosphatase